MGGLAREQEVGVVGAGAMGAGIALVAAAAGHTVRLYDAAPGACDKALERLRADLDRLVSRGKLAAEEAQARLARIRPETDLSGLSSAALVVEAIVENLEIKVEVLSKLEALTASDTVIASNTSSLGITALAARLSRPGRVAGMHFFNPAPAMPLVEVVAGAASEPTVLELVFETAKAWGKVPVHCGSTPGFIVNRVARPFYGEALRLLADRVAEPATLDAVIRESGGFRMGPCELMDLIGHDVNFAVTRSVYDAFFQDPRYRPSLVQQALVEAGRLGRKSGRGFYDYAADAPAAEASSAPSGPKPRDVVVEGDVGAAEPLANAFAAAGLAVGRSEGEGLIRVDGVALALTDGRTALARSQSAGETVVLFDLALDFGAATRIALAAPATATAGEISTACGVFQALGKTVSIVEDASGLIVARTVAMLVNEAADGVQQGLASAADIDLAMMKGANYPLGPLAWAERVGAGWAADVMDALARAYPDGRYRTAPLLRRHALSGGRFLA